MTLKKQPKDVYSVWFAFSANGSVFNKFRSYLNYDQAKRCVHENVFWESFHRGCIQYKGIRIYDLRLFADPYIGGISSGKYSRPSQKEG